MATGKSKIVTKYAKMWPREVFDVARDDSILQTVPDLLNHSGVYVLYRDDIPYYVGKTKKSLFRRIRAHVVRPRDRYFLFWNFFSAFVVPNSDHGDEVEGILITSMQTENHAIPKLGRITLPQQLGKLLLKARRAAISKS